MRLRLIRQGSKLALACAVIAGGLALPSITSAITYTSGDILYVAYQNNPPGAEYVVNLGPRTQFLNATTTFSLTKVTASDLDAIVGATATNIWVGLFGVGTPATQDGVHTANGPRDDTQLNGSSMLGAVQQTDAFGSGLPIYGAPVPSGEPAATSFITSGDTGSYQSSLNASFQGSLGANLTYNVESRLSSSTGVRISTPKKIQFFEGINNTVSGAHSRRPLGYFTLSGNGTITYSPDFDGDLLADEIDLCPGFPSSINTDADSDLHGDPCDCAPADNTSWSLPGQPQNVSVGDATGSNNVFWSAPANPGGTAPLVYDVYMAADNAMGSQPPYTCFVPDTASTTASTVAGPLVGRAWLFVVRAQNACGAGSAGKTVPSCP